MSSSSIRDSLGAGLLPKWLLLIAVVSVGNTVQTFLSLTATRRIYLRAPSSVTPLSARTFGTWTFLSAVIRLYAACNIDNPAVFQLAFASFAVAFAHFSSEWLVFGTAGWSKALAGPAFVSTISMAWMWLTWDSYLG